MVVYVDVMKRTWTTEQEAELRKMWKDNITTPKIAQHTGRTIGAISAKVKRMGLGNRYVLRLK